MANGIVIVLGSGDGRGFRGRRSVTRETQED